MDAFPWIVALTQPSTNNFSSFKTKQIPPKFIRRADPNYWSLWGCVAAGQGRASVEFYWENSVTGHGFFMTFRWQL